MLAVPPLLAFFSFLSSGRACIPTVTPDDMYEQELEGTTSVLMTMVGQEMTSTSTDPSTSISTSTAVGGPAGSTISTISTSTTAIGATGYECLTTAWVLNSATGRCYMAVVTGLNWQVAKDACISLGGNLASISDQTENDYVYNSVILPTSPAAMSLWWIGLKQTENTAELSGTATWEDGTPYDFNVFSNWRNQPPPQAPGQACIRMSVLYPNPADDGTWTAGSTCTAQRPYVCESAAIPI